MDSPARRMLARWCRDVCELRFWHFFLDSDHAAGRLIIGTAYLTPQTPGSSFSPLYVTSMGVVTSMVSTVDPGRRVGGKKCQWSKAKKAELLAGRVRDARTVRQTRPGPVKKTTGRLVAEKGRRPLV
jgi:hypothetical protein